MARIGWIVLLIAVVLLAPSAAIAGKRSGNIHFFVGGKALDSNDWGDLDDPSAFGVEMSWGNIDWPISIATDLFVSATVDTRPADFDLVGGTTELDLSTRWSTVNAGAVFLQDRDAGGFQYGLVIGWGWPKYP